MDEFEGDAAAQEQAGRGQRQAAFEERAAEDFVEGVVTADVLVDEFQFAGRIEEGAGMQAAGGGEGGLGGTQALGQGGELVRIEDRTGWDRRVNLQDSIERGLAADAATRGAEDVAREAFEIDGDGRGEDSVDDVARGAARSLDDLAHAPAD